MSGVGGILEAIPENSYFAMCYDVANTQSVYFRNEEESNFEAYTLDAVRNSYTAMYPDENLIEEPDHLYYDKIDVVDILKNPDPSPQKIHFYPTERLTRYTLEIRKVVGAKYLTSIGLACSGVSA